MADDIVWRWLIDPPMRVGWRTLRALMLLAVVGVTVVTARRYLNLPAIEFGAEGAALNGAILAFLIGFRNKASYDRWWEGRMQWGKLVNDSRNLCLKYREYAQPDTDERRQMTEWIGGFAVALMNHLRTGMDRLARGEPGVRHEAITVAGHVHAEIARLVSQHRIDSIEAQMLDLHASGFMDVSGACERIRGTPLADSYRALLRRGMILQLLAIMVLTTWELGAIGIPTVLIPAYFLIALEFVAEDIENPFGTLGDDLSLETYCATIRRSAEQILIHPADVRIASQSAS
jgi:putative membrane protein